MELSSIAPHFMPAMDFEGRYLIMYGGAGSGKTTTAASKLIMRCMAEPGHRFVCIRKHDSSALFAGVIERSNAICTDGYFRNDMDQSMRFHNGSSITCMDFSDPEKIKSARPTGIWLEEANEFNEVDFIGIDLQLRGSTPSYKQVILTFNPVSIDWIHERFFADIVDDSLDLLGLMIHHSTFNDNPFIDDQYKAVMNELPLSRLGRHTYRDGLFPKE